VRPLSEEESPPEGADLPTPRRGPGAPEPGVLPRVLSATLPCENCGHATVHRVLRWDPKSFPKGARTRGVARCRTCGWTHPFEVVREVRVSVPLIVSRRSESVRETTQFPPDARLSVGEVLPGTDPPLLVRRIDLWSGDSARQAHARDVATLWASVNEGLSIPVSIIEGAHTRPAKWTVDPQFVVTVGDHLEVDGTRIVVVALRAAGHTWRRLEDRFRAEQVQRVYGRRMVSPPAGRSDWSRGRGRPSSRTSSFSRSSRSRSGPGVRRTRTVPRARIASGGAAHQSASPS